MINQVVTGFSMRGLDEYGYRFLDSYVSPFPLVAYLGDAGDEGKNMLGLRVGGVASSDYAQIRMQENIPGYSEFQARWGGKPVACGTDPKHIGGKNAHYNYRFDIVKFSKMIYVMADAAIRISDAGGGLMMWLDGDSVLRRPMPDDMFDRFLPPGYGYSYLGRRGTHTETGFLIFRLPEALPILVSWVEYLNCDTWQNEEEWHSAYLFDRAREQHPKIRGYDLTPGKRGHVIHQCAVGHYIDHLKGNRKTMGKSPEAK